MTGRLLGGVAVLLLAGCAPAAQQEAPAEQQKSQSSAQPSAAGEPVSPEQLFGQWRLVEMPGVPQDQPLEIHLLIGRYGIEAVSQCITFRKILPGVVFPDPPNPHPDQPEPVCARMLSPIEQKFGPMLAAATSMERLGEGRALLRGAKGDLVIARNEEPVLNPLQNVPGPGPFLLWGEWRIAAIDGSAPDTPMSLLFFKNRLEFGSGCVHFGRYIEQQGAELRLSPDPTVTTICERMTSPAEEAAERIWSGTVRIAESSPRRRLLRGAEGTILLGR